MSSNLKPDNFLVIEKYVDGKREIKILLSDFGKSRKLGPEGTASYWGNSRNEPPEKRLSQKGDIYSLRNILIRILEEPYLEGKGESLLPIDQPKADPNTSMREVVNDQGNLVEIYKYRGFERYITQHPDCSQWDTRAGLLARLSVYTGRFSMAFFSSEAVPHDPEEVACLRYVVELTKRMSSEEMSNGTRKNLQNLLHNINAMSATDPNLRPALRP